MKTLFIPTTLKSKANKSKILELSKELPKNIAIAYSIQYKDIASQIKAILSNNHKITKLIQVLGCTKIQVSKDTEAILLIGDGTFHAISLAIETKLPIYILENNRLIQISGKDVKDLEKKQKASYLKFLEADKVGILVSVKPGQENLKKAISIKKTLDKQAYILIGQDIDAREFENFGLDSWINTACPRLDFDDSRIINIDKIDK